MLKIRLSRIGKRNIPNYRVLLQEGQRATVSKSIEILGSYNPRSKEKILNAERILYWISKGAQCSPTMNNLLIKEGILKEGKKMKATHVTAKKKAKLEEKKQKVQIAKGKKEKQVEKSEPKIEEVKK